MATFLLSAGSAGLVLGVGAAVTAVLFHRQLAYQKKVITDRPGTIHYDHAALPSTLPDPVKKYFKRSLGDGPLHFPVVVQLKHVGILKMKPEEEDESKAWQSLVAEQTLALDKPGFLWTARIPMGPLLMWVLGYDTYWNGKGAMQWRLMGAVPVVGVDGMEVTQAAFTRWLEEAPSCPVALLPRPGVDWESIDGSHARILISFDGLKAEAVVEFDEQYNIIKLTTDSSFRRLPNNEFEPATWVGVFTKSSALTMPLAGNAGLMKQKMTTLHVATEVEAGYLNEETGSVDVYGKFTVREFLA